MAQATTFRWLPLKSVVIYTALTFVALQIFPCTLQLFDHRYGWPFVGVATGPKGPYSEDISLKLANIGISTVLVLAVAMLALRIHASKTASTFTLASALKLTLYVSLVFALWSYRHDLLAAILVSRGYPPSDAYINWRQQSIPLIFLPGVWVGLLSVIAWLGIAIGLLWNKLFRSLTDGPATDPFDT